MKWEFILRNHWIVRNMINAPVRNAISQASVIEQNVSKDTYRFEPYHIGVNR